ncbi:hypothetical protein WJX73_009741 [Symbiochloris irregularis]|uniref:PARP-type domain-containing protein n=1 Tax=Symbiochloris irregularis TaxID=706552 RepID=A0AAW1NZH2_9CHLO
MSDTDDTAEKKSVVKVEQASTGRSTCRATGEKIEKGEWRAGMEAWVAGRVNMTWQKLLPFLQNCSVETCSGKGNNGTCKQSGHKFTKGEARFVAVVKEKRNYLTLESAATELKPALEAIDSAEFVATDFKGLEELSQEDRQKFIDAFQVSAEAADKLAPAKPSSDENSDAEVKQPAAKKQKRGADGPSGGAGNSDAEAAPSGASQVVNEYEQRRAEQIARNRERLMALNLPALAAQVAPPKPARSTVARGLKARKKEKPPPGPRRESLRNKGIAADGTYIDDERRGGKVVYGRTEVTDPGPWVKAEDPPPPKARFPKGPVEFTSKNGSERIDKQMLELVRGVGGSPGKKKTTVKQMAQFDLKAEGVAKVSHAGISHLSFHPGTSHLLLATGDKDGNVGLWNVDHIIQSDDNGDNVDDDDAADDGVLEFQPHYSYVSGLRWIGGLGSSARLVTCSYDGSVRSLDLEKGQFEAIVLDEESEWSAMDCTSKGSCVYLGDKAGNLAAYDPRSHKSVLPEFSIHDKKVNTLQVEPGEEHLLLSSSSDKSLALWDTRKLGPGCRAVAQAEHPQTCNSAFFSPDGAHRVMSLSRDNTIRVWDGKKGLSELLKISHNNNTGRWTIPFRAVWGPSSDCCLVGNMGRTVDVFDASTGAKAAALSSESMTAIVSRVTAHISTPALAAATGSGRVHIYR